MSDQRSESKIGAMNGRWKIMFQIALATYPIIVSGGIAWAVWLTSQEYQDIAFRNSSERFTQADGADLERRFIEKLTSASHHLGDDWRDQIIKIEVNQDKMLKTLTEIQVQIARIQTK